METRNLLLDSVCSIKQIDPEQAGSDAAATAFNSFRRGVVHASSGRTGPPESLLGDLEPKGHVLKFLVCVYMQRRILRKQVGAVLAELLHVDTWLDTLRKDKALCAQLPDDLASLLAEREEEEKEDAVEIVEVESEPTSPNRDSQSVSSPVAKSPTKPGSTPWDLPSPKPVLEKSTPDRNGKIRPKWSQVRTVISKAAANDGIALPIRVACPTSTGHYAAGNIRLSKTEHDAVSDLLEQGRSQMEALNFSAVDKDVAISAFETFRRAVQQVVNSTLSKQDDNLLDRLEPKGRILEFLVDMYELHQKYRSRVTSTLMRLLNFDGWRYAAESDDSVRAAVADFQDMRANSAVNSVGVVSLNLKTVASNAAMRGGVGALHVQILAGYDLVAADSNGTSDPYVRVRLGNKTQRTHVVNDCLNPQWNANPFIFEVPSADSILKLECLDNDFFKDDPIGDLEVSIANAPRDPAASVMRCALNNVQHGEIEFKLLYLPAKESSQENEVAMQGQTAATEEAPDTETDPSPRKADVASALSALWTPWGTAPTPQTESKPQAEGQAESKMRAETQVSLNPFDSDSSLPQGGYAVGTESRQAPPAIFTSGPRMGSEGDVTRSDISPSAARTPTPGAWMETPTPGATPTSRQETISRQNGKKQTNPFEALEGRTSRPKSMGTESATSTGTNPFEVEPPTTAKEPDTRSLNARNPFLE